jgi:hypothetical protein
MDKYFIFKNGLKGLEGQIVYGNDHVNGSGKSTLNEVFKVKLEGKELVMSLDELILKFKDSVKQS